MNDSAQALGEEASKEILPKSTIAATRERGEFFLYLGFSLLLAYHYVLWFVDDSFFHTQLLDSAITNGWLGSLTATSLTMALVGFIRPGKRHLSDAKTLVYAVPVLTALSALALGFSSQIEFMQNHVAFIIIACVNGMFEALFLLLWGELLIRKGLQLALRNFGITFGATLIVAMLVAFVLPEEITPFFAPLVAIASGIKLMRVQNETDASYPQLLPKKARKRSLTTILGIGGIALVTGLACYFLTAIAPVDHLAFGSISFSIGVACAGLFLVGVSLIVHLTTKKQSVPKLFPWLIVGSILALCLYVADGGLETLSFLIALSVATMLEAFLIMCFSLLTHRGFFPPATSFAITFGSVRIGIVIGNIIALAFEDSPHIMSTFGTEASLLMIFILAALLIPITRKETVIIELTSAPAAPNETEEICRLISEEFRLSEREHEVLRLLARGNSANGIATKLVISPHTVNTHIRHIYDKVGIHKRSELIDYINMRRTDNH